METIETLAPGQIAVNNALYDTLGERWYTAKDDPVALLRAESHLRNPWIIDTIASETGNKMPLDVLDIGCGGGFLSNALAKAGHRVTGVDLSEESLAVARKYDTTRTVVYQPADAYQLPFEGGQFDVVCAMDFLEHVEDPARVVQEASRVLKPGGLFFFHTFNRNILSTLVVIKAVEWLVKNTPPRMHVSRLFIKPSELKAYCEKSKMTVIEMRGLKPVLLSRAVLKGVFTGCVEDGFQFEFGKSLLMSYCGYARKEKLILN